MNRWRSGLPAFRVVALGQLVSMLGGEISGFALIIWAFDQTGSALSLGLLSVFSLVPLIVVSPIAGAIVDRSNRKWMMMLADVVAAVVTLAVLLLHLIGALEVWHLYGAVAFISVAQAFQGPAYASAISLMVPKSDYDKANALVGLADSAKTIGGPALAALLYPLLGLGGILILDLASFLFAFASLIFIRVPQPPPAAETRAKVNWREEVTFGFRYIFANPSLRGLLFTSALFNFAFGVSQAVQPALILARGDEAALAVVRTAMGVGGVIGGLALSTWGAPRQRFLGVMAGMGLYALGLGVMAVGREVWVWAASSFLVMAVSPLIGASGAAIWQRKVAPEFQGRILASRRVVTWVSSPLGTLIAGVLADRVLTPGMNPGGALEPIFGALVGVGMGAGFAVTLLFAAVWAGLVVGAALSNPVVREVETRVPDFDDSRHSSEC